MFLSFGNNGCDGGEDYRAYQWIMRHGLPTEDDYGGYLGQVGPWTLHITVVCTLDVLSGVEYDVCVCLFVTGRLLPHGERDGRHQDEGLGERHRQERERAEGRYKDPLPLCV